MEDRQPLLSLSFFYLFRRLWYHIAIFFHRWYVDGSYFFARTWLSIFLSLEQTFALKITLAHFFEPLYQDYTLMGQIIGPIFRLGRVVVAGFFYTILCSVFLFLYILWISIPVMLLLQAFLAFLSQPA